MDWKINGFAIDSLAGVEELPKDFTEQDLIGLAFFRHIRRKVVEGNFSHIGSIDGRHRSGKSLTAVAMGCLFDPRFEKYMEQRVVYTPVQFQRAINNISKMHDDGYDMRGSCVVLDEAGTTVSSDEWYQDFMKVINKTIQVFGYLNPIILIVAPVQDFVNAKIRKMLHTYYKLKRYNNDYATITPYNIDYNTVRQKWFFKKPKIRVLDREVQIKRINISKPPARICERYEQISNPVKRGIIDGGEQSLMDMEAPKAKKIGIEEIIKKVVEEYKIYETKRSRPDSIILDATRIQYHFNESGITSRMSYMIKASAEQRLNQRKEEPTIEVQHK
jgi:hypothetical protein